MKIRLCGLVLLLLSGACFTFLIRLATLPAGAGASPLKLALAAGCVLTGLTGLAPLFCGPKLFAQLPVPLRSRHPATGVVDAI